MKILITGSRGQLGNELQKILQQGKAEVGAIPSIYQNAEVVYTDTLELDITDKKAVNNFFSRNIFDLIINCAAMTNVDGCESNEELAYKINAEGSLNLARAAEQSGAQFIQVSTDYVFSGVNNSERVETDMPDPQSAYGRTKLAGEKLVAENCSKHYIVRTAWLYGYVGSNFVKTMLRLARENGYIKVVNDQFGNPTSANDLAFEILKIAATDEYGIYHCTNRGTCSWFDFASAIVDEANIECEKIPCTTEEFPRPAKRPKFSALRNRHLEKTVGDEMRPWQDALKNYLKNLSTGEAEIL